MELKPIEFKGLKSISDDDLCATCQHCEYRPGSESGCKQGWPGMQDGDGYVQECTQHVEIDNQEDNWVADLVEGAGDLLEGVGDVLDLIGD